MADVSIWNTARTLTEINNDMTHRLIGNESGLAGYWRMSEGSGTTVADSQTNGTTHDGTATNTGWGSLDQLTLAGGTDSYQSMVLGFDPQGDALTYSVSTNPTHGAVTLNNGNTFEYTPNTPASPVADSFILDITDGTHTTSHTVSLA